VEFIGDKATVVADRGNWSVKTGDSNDTEQAMLEAAKFRKKSSHSDVGNHVRNFLDCIASRDKPKCSIETGRNVALYAHMGNIAARSGDGKITWQAERQSFDNSKAANALIMPQYRNAWKLPSI
jgi:hypothetical protein